MCVCTLLSVFISFCVSPALTPTLLISAGQSGTFTAHTDNMLWTLLTLIAALTYVDAAITLTQTPAVLTVAPGEEAVLKCNIERDYGNFVSWFKQTDGEDRQYVLRYYYGHNHPDFGTGFSSDRFHSKCTSKLDYQFIIKRAEIGDSAVYLCKAWDTSSEAWTVVFGAGSKLIVTNSTLPPHVLTVLPPSSANLCSDKAFLACLSTQSVPFGDVSWFAAGSPVDSGIFTSMAVQQPDQTFQISSYLAISMSDWNMDKVYTCRVSVGTQTSEKTINKSQCPTQE
ncbi:immunoglobulin lambda-1 light chain-like [Cheilinus undulatus]|uniref:immunoglobulin lambda-1 light chain-like n=1 Tax=Cheilinus undulatus TaxID=241271 RepID=UPI001BD5F20D|nr:immunoglobulin lambda-1 light chain-like [Cheilinus undulatus]